MTITITKSSERDLRAILYRLKKEHAASELEYREIFKILQKEYVTGVAEGYWNNRKLIREAHRKGELYVLRENDKWASFHFKTELGILYVRPDKRGKGYGRILANLWIERARANGEAYVAVQCKPATSLPFWQAMGFTPIETHLGLYAYRILKKRFDLDDDAELVEVEIRFYESMAAHEMGSQPVFTHRPEAVRDGNNVKLAERVICLDTSLNDALAVTIQVDGQTVYFGKARSWQSKALGIKRYAKEFYSAFYCDCLILSGSIDSTVPDSLAAASPSPAVVDR